MITRMNVWEHQVGRAAATFGSVGRSNGYLVPIMSKTDLSFDGRAIASPNGLQDIPIAVGIDSSSWVSAVLLVKLHQKGTWATNGILRVLAQNIMLVPEEPDVVYLSTAAAAAEVTFVFGDAAPALKLTPFTGVIGPMLRVLLRWEQGTVAAGAAQTASISVDLVGRPA